MRIAQHLLKQAASSAMTYCEKMISTGEFTGNCLLYSASIIDGRYSTAILPSLSTSLHTHAPTAHALRAIVMLHYHRACLLFLHVSHAYKPDECEYAWFIVKPNKHHFNP